MKNITVHTDGGARGNPGPAAIGYVIEGLADQAISAGQKIGSTTNNQAEYRALIAALVQLSERDLVGATVSIYLDSELVVKQMLGEYRVKDVGLRELSEQAQTLVKSLESRNCQLDLSAVPRSQNKEADWLVNQALDDDGS